MQIIAQSENEEIIDLKIENFKFQVNDAEKELIFKAMKKFFIEIKSDIKKSKSIDAKNYSVNTFLFKEIATISIYHKTKLINAFAFSPNQYLLKFVLMKDADLRAMFTIIAENNKGNITFSSPIKIRTENWENKQIGNVHYFYKDSFNEKAAKQFNRKNSEIAKKFGVPIKRLTYYKCSNYEEVQRLLGIDFDSKNAGTVQSSEDFENTIITGVNSEDYSHDLFHMYVQTKFPDDKHRNFIAEEGYANSITDAYYAKNNGEIISRRELVFYLKEYLEKNPNADFLELFQTNPRVYFQLLDQVSYEVFNLLSVRSTITSLICDAVEKVKGFESLINLLRSGKGEDNFFRVTNDLIDLNKSNFDKKTQKLIRDFS